MNKMVFVGKNYNSLGHPGLGKRLLEVLGIFPEYRKMCNPKNLS